MSSETKPLLVPLQGMPSPCDAFESVIKNITMLASKPDLQNTVTLLDEINHRKRQNEIKKEELAKVQNHLEVDKRKMEAAMQANLEIYEKVKRDQKCIETERDSLQNLHAEKVKDLEERAQEVESLQATVAKLQSDHSQETVKERDTKIENLHGEGSTLRTTLNDQRKKNEDLKKEITLLHEKGQKAQSQLDNLESFTFGYTEVNEDEMLDEFSGLWEYATNELFVILNQNLETKVLSDKLIWDKFRKDSELAVQHRVLLPSSNSPAAKAMRLVVILGILARELDKCIFQPTYLLEESNLREILCTLAKKDHEKESFCRSLLLSIDNDAQQGSLQLRIQAVVRNVSSYLYDALSEPQYSEIRQCIENIAQRAVKIWRPIQSSRKRYEPDFEPLKWGDDEWCPFRFPGDVGKLELDPNVRNDNLLTVFPRISLVEDNKRYPQTFVTQLMKSQKLCGAAEQEMPREATSPKLGRMSSNGQRRKSIAQSTPHQNGGSSFLREIVSLSVNHWRRGRP
ncbi:hypothetical protein N7526_003329 [Penicillium atrosanguineum]|nr:hypothetical protein N7526_003329 [Penicillium atrosanguineum]